MKKRLMRLCLFVFLLTPIVVIASTCPEHGIVSQEGQDIIRAQNDNRNILVSKELVIKLSNAFTMLLLTKQAMLSAFLADTVMVSGDGMLKHTICFQRTSLKHLILILIMCSECTSHTILTTK